MTWRSLPTTARRLSVVFGLAIAAASLAAPAQAAGGAPPDIGPIADLADLLDPAQEQQLRSIIDDGSADGTVVIEVLTVDRMSDWTVGTGTGTIESFAQGVFETWGIGDPTENNGALIVVSRGDREARIELGLGFAGRYDGAMNTVMSEVMVPRFRDDEYGTGIVEGARRMLTRLREAPLPLTTPVDEPDDDDGGGVPWIPIGLRVGGVAAAGGAVAKSRIKKCSKCSARCRLVGEQDDDVYLDEGQRCEEFLRSVNYRAWRCPSCSFVFLTRHQRLFSRSKQCGKCGFRTARSSQSTLTAATYSSSGTALVTTTCQQPSCRHQSEHHITLPQLTRSSSSSSSSFSSSGRSSSGGGRSGGGGASGSW